MTGDAVSSALAKLARFSAEERVIAARLLRGLETSTGAPWPIGVVESDANDGSFGAATLQPGGGSVEPGASLGDDEAPADRRRRKDRERKAGRRAAEVPQTGADISADMMRTFPQSSADMSAEVPQTGADISADSRAPSLSPPDLYPSFSRESEREGFGSDARESGVRRISAVVSATESAPVRTLSAADADADAIVSALAPDAEPDAEWLAKARMAGLQDPVAAWRKFRGHYSGLPKARTWRGWGSLFTDTWCTNERAYEAKARARGRELQQPVAAGEKPFWKSGEEIT